MEPAGGRAVAGQLLVILGMRSGKADHIAKQSKVNLRLRQPQAGPVELLQKCDKRPQHGCQQEPVMAEGWTNLGGLFDHEPQREFNPNEGVAALWGV